MHRALIYFGSIFNGIIMKILDVSIWYNLVGLNCQKGGENLQVLLRCLSHALNPFGFGAWHNSWTPSEETIKHLKMVGKHLSPTKILLFSPLHFPSPQITPWYSLYLGFHFNKICIYMKVLLLLFNLEYDIFPHILLLWQKKSIKFLIFVNSLN